MVASGDAGSPLAGWPAVAVGVAGTEGDGLGAGGVVLLELEGLAEPPADAGGATGGALLLAGPPPGRVGGGFCGCAVVLATAAADGVSPGTGTGTLLGCAVGWLLSG